MLLCLGVQGAVRVAAPVFVLKWRVANGRPAAVIVAYVDVVVQ